MQVDLQNQEFIVPNNSHFLENQQDYSSKSDKTPQQPQQVHHDHHDQQQQHQSFKWISKIRKLSNPEHLPLNQMQNLSFQSKCERMEELKSRQHFEESRMEEVESCDDELQGESNSYKEYYCGKKKSESMELEFLRKALVDLQKENEQLHLTLKHETNVRIPHVVPAVFTVGNGMAESQIDRRSSISTLQVLHSLPQSISDKIAMKITEAFINPIPAMEYLHSQSFGYDLLKLCKNCSLIFEKEPRCLTLSSPLYIFGDIHGNLDDLKYFSENIWNLGIKLTGGKFLFLGDYVDRGLCSLECLAYLYSQKIMHPTKVFLLRGNHETRAINGCESYFKNRCLLSECKSRFGIPLGLTIWQEINSTFDRMPLAAIVDKHVFCVHGGIPRKIPSENRIESLNKLSPILYLDPPYCGGRDRNRDKDKDRGSGGVNLSDPMEPLRLQFAKDCLWADPATDEQETCLEATGFGLSNRGGGTLCYGSKAIDEFLKENSLLFIIRAHEARSKGVGLSKSARVFTVFSTSRDHGKGEKAQCGCILLDNNQIMMINRSLEYKKPQPFRYNHVEILQNVQRNSSYKDFTSENSDDNNNQEEE